jgi:hypothetical protein
MSDPANPKDGIGARKVGINFLSGKVILRLAERFGGISGIPQQPLFEMALAFVEGAYKYGAHNYRAFGVRASIYYAAFNRHMTQYITRQSDIDKDSSIHHTAKAMACIAILLESSDMGNWVDDRPLRLTRPPVAPERDEVSTATGLHDKAKEHMVLWWEGGHEHLLMDALCTTMILRQKILDGTLEDDRVAQPFDIDTMNDVAKEIACRYPNPVPPFTQVTHGKELG